MGMKEETNRVSIILLSVSRYLESCIKPGELLEEDSGRDGVVLGGELVFVPFHSEDPGHQGREQ